MVQTLKVTGENVTFLLALNDTRVNNLTGFGWTCHSNLTGVSAEDVDLFLSPRCIKVDEDYFKSFCLKRNHYSTIGNYWQSTLWYLFVKQAFVKILFFSISLEFVCSVGKFPWLICGVSQTSKYPRRQIDKFKTMYEFELFCCTWL